MAGAQVSLFELAVTKNQEDLREVMSRTLRELREILHRSGRLSSRHEALDEVAKLLFAHVVSIDGGGGGICRESLAEGKPVAVALRGFVRQAFKQQLPYSLSHELKAEDFELRMKESEDRFAGEIVECFGHLASRKMMAQIRGLEGVDILNDTFGQFLADSFIDEKELGQYLTPTEVVRFMVRLGLQSLEKSDLAGFCNPERSDGELILDPSCGVGSFLAETLRVLFGKVKEKCSEDALSVWLRSMMESTIIGIDKSERMIKLALTNLALFGVPTVNLHLANALIRTGSDAEVTERINGKAKLILTNPPFGAEFPVSDLSRYKIATEWSPSSLKSVDSELLFLERYIEWLSPGGVLVAIVPDSILTNRGIFECLRKGLADSVRILNVVSLPNVTFGVAGTNTKTSILHLKKLKKRSARIYNVYYAVCENIGYDVLTRGAHRRKVSNGASDLIDILSEASRETDPRIGRVVRVSAKEPRWDATYHAGLPGWVQGWLDVASTRTLKVRDIAFLSNDRVDPSRMGTATFDYIEISDVEARTCGVRAKTIECRNAPSRARKIVRSGDILVSTVRPERRTIGVVPSYLDGAVCSTGFAVLRCTNAEPLVVARLLQTDHANYQILRNNVGIAYPAIDEQCLLDVVLPAERREMNKLAQAAKGLPAARVKLRLLEKEFDDAVQRVIEKCTMT